MAAIDFFKELQSDRDNFLCFDCNRSGAQWASINNGIFLCFDCSAHHRGLGVQSSFVRSTTMDSWNPTQLKMMSLGGNRRLREFMEMYSLPSNTNLFSKYNSKALEYYREVLKAESDDRIHGSMPPSFTQAQVSQAPPPPPRPTYTSLSSRPYMPEPVDNSWLGTAKTLVSKAGEIANNASGVGIISSLKTVTTSAFDISLELGSNIADKIGSDSLKSFGQKSVNVLSSVGELAYESAQMAINKVKGKESKSESFHGNEWKNGNYSSGSGAYRPPETGNSYSAQSYSGNSYSSFGSERLNAPNKTSFLSNRGNY